MRKILTTLSLFLCLAAVAFWIACNGNLFYLYYRAGDFTKSPQTDYGVIARSGGLQIEKLVNSPLDEKRWVYGQESWTGFKDGAHGSAPAMRESENAFFGLGYGRRIYEKLHISEVRPPAPDGICDFITLPYWFLTLLFAAAPVRESFRDFRQRRHMSQGTLCIKCGYDVRASEYRCPECGTPIPTPKRAGILPPA